MIIKLGARITSSLIILRLETTVRPKMKWIMLS